MSAGPKQYAELHLHLGGAIIPRILYTNVQRWKYDRVNPDRAELAAQYIKKYPTYEKFERKLIKPSDTLAQYLEAHKVVEPLQTIDTLAYFVTRMLRGCHVFENLSYLELRFNPYFRLPKGLPINEIRPAMKEMISTIALAASVSYREYPIVFTQILCMDSRLPKEINYEILMAAKEMKDEVAAVDLAGPDDAYAAQAEDLLSLLELAKKQGQKVTCHLFETPMGCYPDFLQFCDRIGHGIQIPLRQPKLLTQVAKRKQCLEVCPTSYLRTGTIQSYAELRPVFTACFDLGIDIAVCTDNSAFHQVRLPVEFERLLTHKVIGFKEMERCREAAFKHAFRWPGSIERRTGMM